MKKVQYITLFLLLQVFNGYSQDTLAPKPVEKGKFYISAGWHRAWYTRSTIEFRNPASNYDFKILKAKAVDDNDLNIGQGIDAPQWSIRAGYFFRSGWGIELSYDHAKYILSNGQKVRLVGNIGQQYYDRDTTIHPGFISYEHTDGANYYMLSLVRLKNLKTGDAKKRLDWLVKAGAGPVIPRTSSRILGMHYDERYHLSGYVLGLENSLRQELIKNIFAEISLKTVFASFKDVLLHGSGKANQKWGSALLLFTITYAQ